MSFCLKTSRFLGTCDSSKAAPARFPEVHCNILSWGCDEKSLGIIQIRDGDCFQSSPWQFYGDWLFFKGTIGWMDSRTTFKTIGGLDDHDPLVTNYTNSCLGHAIWIAKLWEREPKSKMGKQQWWTVNQQTCDNYQVNMVCKWQLIQVMWVGQTYQKWVLKFCFHFHWMGIFVSCFLGSRGVGFNPFEQKARHRLIHEDNKLWVHCTNYLFDLFDIPQEMESPWFIVDFPVRNLQS